MHAAGETNLCLFAFQVEYNSVAPGEENRSSGMVNMV